MSPFDRRGLLSGVGKSGALLAASRWLSLCGYAQTTRGPARVFLRDRVPAATFDRRVQGAFLEPLGRAVYTQKIDYPSRFATCDARSHELQR
jgi:hypothetical protein